VWGPIDRLLYFFAERLGDERSESEVEITTSELGLKAGEQVADVASGHGRISNRLARDGMVVNGGDASAHYLDILRSQRRNEGSCLL
jgi:2-polyprenyl-3-methyl-5-hydroxy-6-metoxy-1,4-benzoquinol methylase